MTVTSVLPFPLDPVLLRLLVAASRTPISDIVVHDAYGYEKTYLQLVGDIVQMRSLLQTHLSASATNDKGLLQDDSRYIGLLSKSGYEFLVAFFAIRSLGGAPILLSKCLQHS
jgi:malonyl-CoA/methylmalonyl-CoA synthetase